MKLGIQTLPPFTLLILLISCNEGNEAIECNEYYLTEESSGDHVTKIFYNDDGLISAMESRAASVSNRLDVYYDEDKRIKEVKNIEHAHLTEFFHDPSGRLIATIRYEDGLRLDSFAIEYDASGRITKRSIYISPPPYTLLDSYYEVEYPADRAMKVNFYLRVPSTWDTFEYTGTFSYTMDDRRRPYPDEYYSMYLSWTNVVPTNNFTSLEVTDKNGTVTSHETYEYEYNPAGYPLRRSTRGSALAFKYDCKPATE